MARKFPKNQRNLTLLAAGCFLLALLVGCKNAAKAKTKSNGDSAASSAAPENITGQFVVHFKAASGKIFPVHMSFLLCTKGSSAEWSTKVDSDGGLNASGEKTSSGKQVGIKPNTKLAMVLDSGASEGNSGAGNPNSSDSTGVNVPVGMNGNTKTTTGNSLVMRLDDPNSDAAGTSADPKSGKTETDDSVGKKIFVTKEPAKDPAIKFEILRGETGVWRAQNLQYDGFPGLLEMSEAAPTCDWQ